MEDRACELLKEEIKHRDFEQKTVEVSVIAILTNNIIQRLRGYQKNDDILTLVRESIELDR